MNLRRPVPTHVVPIVTDHCRLGRGIGGEAGVEVVPDLRSAPRWGCFLLSCVYPLLAGDSGIVLEVNLVLSVVLVVAIPHANGLLFRSARVFVLGSGRDDP